MDAQYHVDNFLDIGGEKPCGRRGRVGLLNKQRQVWVLGWPIRKKGVGEGHGSVQENRRQPNKRREQRSRDVTLAQSGSVGGGDKEN